MDDPGGRLRHGAGPPGAERMTYELIHITLRDVPAEQYTAVIQLLTELGLYDRAAVIVGEAGR